MHGSSLCSALFHASLSAALSFPCISPSLVPVQHHLGPAGCPPLHPFPKSHSSYSVANSLTGCGSAGSWPLPRVKCGGRKRTWDKPRPCCSCFSLCVSFPPSVLLPQPAFLPLTRKSGIETPTPDSSESDKAHTELSFTQAVAGTRALYGYTRVNPIKSRGIEHLQKSSTQRISWFTSECL